MDITPIISEKINVITSYGNNGFRINETLHKGSLFITANIMELWNINNFNDINIDSFDNFKISNDEIELLIIGTGKIHFNLPKALLAFFKKNNIKVEAMQTGAACRTYNVLISEDRKVAAFLIAI